MPQIKKCLARIVLFAFLLAGIGFVGSCNHCQSHKTAFGDPDKINVVVVTGGHDFERDPFFTLFQGYDDIQYVVAVQADTLCQIRDIAIRLEQKLRWDPAHERLVDNDTANCRLVRAMRSPWHL